MYLRTSSDVLDRRVYFGKHPYINIVNWGEGNDRTPEERARLKAERDKRNRLRELGLQRLARRRERSRRTTEQQQRSATSQRINAIQDRVNRGRGSRDRGSRGRGSRGGGEVSSALAAAVAAGETVGNDSGVFMQM